MDELNKKVDQFYSLVKEAYFSDEFLAFKKKAKEIIINGFKSKKNVDKLSKISRNIAYNIGKFGETKDERYYNKANELLNDFVKVAGKDCNVIKEKTLTLNGALNQFTDTVIKLCENFKENQALINTLIAKEGRLKDYCGNIINSCDNSNFDLIKQIINVELINGINEFNKLIPQKIIAGPGKMVLPPMFNKVMSFYKDLQTYINN